MTLHSGECDLRSLCVNRIKKLGGYIGLGLWIG